MECDRADDQKRYALRNGYQAEKVAADEAAPTGTWLAGALGDQAR